MFTAETFGRHRSVLKRKKKGGIEEMIHNFCYPEATAVSHFGLFYFSPISVHKVYRVGYIM